jgi:small subunit ribosomal protein S16
VERVAVCIRLKRLGRRNRLYWRICATDKRTARDGRVIEELGSYDPCAPNDRKVAINRERVAHWLRLGARPSETVEQLLAHVGLDRKGNDVAPRPWRKKKAPPPPAAKKAEETMPEAKPEETKTEAPAAPKAKAESADQSPAPQEEKSSE